MGHAVVGAWLSGWPPSHPSFVPSPRPQTFLDPGGSRVRLANHTHTFTLCRRDGVSMTACSCTYRNTHTHTHTALLFLLLGFLHPVALTTPVISSFFSYTLCPTSKPFFGAGLASCQVTVAVSSLYRSAAQAIYAFGLDKTTSPANALHEQGIGMDSSILDFRKPASKD
jgi:hypothetical protein